MLCLLQSYFLKKLHQSRTKEEVNHYYKLLNIDYRKVVPICSVSYFLFLTIKYGVFNNILLTAVNILHLGPHDRNFRACIVNENF